MSGPHRVRPVVRGTCGRLVSPAMGATAALAAAELRVDPGGTTAVTLDVRNTGQVVDHLTFEVLGDAAPWAVLDPPTVTLYPGAETTVTVTFAPPRLPTTPAGAVEFAVAVRSEEDPEGAIAEEGVLEVTAFRDIGGELIPTTARGIRRGRYQLAVDNRGNQPFAAAILVSDPDDLLDFAVDRAVVEAPPDTAVLVPLTVRPRLGFWRGPPRSRPFQVHLQPEEGSGPVLDGTFVILPRLPEWLPQALAALAALVLLAVILYYTVFRPTVDDLARQAAAEELAQEQTVVDQQVAQAADAAERASEAAATAAEDATTVEDLLGPGGGAAGGTTAGTAEITDAQTFRVYLNRSVAPGAEAAAVYPVPDGQRLAVTDYILQNGAGDSGLVELRQDADQPFDVDRMENFRSRDEHFVTPLVLDGGTELVFNVRCENAPPTACNPGVLVSGVIGLPAEGAAGAGGTAGDEPLELPVPGG